jgi:hypothetical protein
MAATATGTHAHVISSCAFFGVRECVKSEDFDKFVFFSSEIFEKSSKSRQISNLIFTNTPGFWIFSRLQERFET